MPTRRQLIKGAGGIGGSMILGGTAVTLLTQPSKATQITVKNLSVPDANEDVATPVQSAKLNVSGAYSVDSQVVPDRVILRLEGKRSTQEDYQQLNAEEPSTQLAKQFSESFDFKANLLDLDRVNAPNLTPDSIGESVSINIDLRLTLTVRHNGSTIKTVSVTEEANLTVNKTEAQVTIGINATGGMNVTG